jgi:purine catabolism regulator
LGTSCIMQLVSVRKTCLPNGQGSQSIILSRIEGQAAYHIPLSKNGQLLGYFLVMSPNLRNASLDKGVYHQAAVILSYHLEEIQHHQTLTVGLRLGEAIERHLQGGLSLEDVKERAKRLNGDIWKGAYLCIVTPLNDLTLNEQQQKKVFIRQLQGAMKDAPPLTELTAHHMFVHSKLFSLIQITDKMGSDFANVKRITNSYSQLLRFLTNGSPLSYVSSMKRTIETFMDGYEECLEAQRLSEQFSVAEPVTYFSDLEFTYLLRHVPATIMNTYTDKLLQPLWQKDEDYITEMLRTLGSYFEHNGLINDTAKDLYIHRNTVLYRLEKIGELLHLDLKNPNDLLRLKLALLFKQLV